MENYIYDIIFLEDSTVIIKDFIELGKVNTLSINTIF